MNKSRENDRGGKSVSINESGDLTDHDGKVAKIRVSGKVFCNEREIVARIYIHLKGRLRARVTHLDIESPYLKQEIPHICKQGEQSWPKLSHVEGGFILSTTPTLKVLSKTLEPYMSDTPTTVMVGGKGSRGIFIGLSKEVKDAIRQEFDPRLKNASIEGK